MLHLKNHLGVPFRHLWLFPLARFAATTAAAGAPTPFAVGDYLVATCGLTAAQAAKAVGRAKTLSRLESPSKPDAVLALLSGLGLSTPDIAAAIIRDPNLLCCNADKILASRVAELRDLDLSPSQIAQFVVLAPAGFRHPNIVTKLQYFIPLFGSFDNFFRALKNCSFRLLTADLERVVKPNVSCLRECTLTAHQISKTCMYRPRLLYCKQVHVRAILACTEDIGIRRGTPMFRHALTFVANHNKETMAGKMELLKKTFRWSDAEVASAVSTNPSLLAISADKAQRVSEFLFSEVGLDLEYIAGRSKLITYSLEGRLMPRHYVVKFLKANGLLGLDRSYYAAVSLTEKVFVHKYIHPYKETAPQLAEDYADACRGEMPSRFRLQEPGTALASV
jgi:mTERF domain-containing protein